MKQALFIVFLAVAPWGFRQNALAQAAPADASGGRPVSGQAADPERPFGTPLRRRRHHVALYAPDQTLLNSPDRTGLGMARVTSASAHYQYFVVEEMVFVGSFAGAATTHPRLRDVAGQWSGLELGLTAGIGRYLGDYVWIGTQLRASLVRAPFRIDGYVPSVDRQFFTPALDVRSALRQNNLEVTSLFRVYFGNSGVYLSLEGGLSVYERGIFSDVDLYPGFERDVGFLFNNVTRLPQNGYNGSMALRGRLGVGFAW